MDSLDLATSASSAGPKGLQPADYTIDVEYGLRDQPVPLKQPGDGHRPHVKPSELVQARLVFCIPENEELEAYWDKVDNRLYNIRNCMHIAGVRRRLELFAPAIDPHMLVRIARGGPVARRRHERDQRQPPSLPVHLPD